MKKRSTLLVSIGVVVFVLGAGVVLLSLKGSSKPSGTPVSVSAGGANTPVVVAVKAMPAGTTGEALIENHAVALTKAAPGSYRTDDLVSLGALNQEALAVGVTAGQPIEAANLRLNAGALAAPPGDESIALTLPSGPSGGAGYLAPGDNVDIYGTVTKISAPVQQGQPLPLPCTALVETKIQVLDVSTQVAPYRSNPTATGRAVPTNVTVLVAATPLQARTLVFWATNESIYLTMSATNEAPLNTGTCAALTTSPNLAPTS